MGATIWVGIVPEKLLLRSDNKRIEVKDDTVVGIAPEKEFESKFLWNERGSKRLLFLRPEKGLRVRRTILEGT